MPPKLHEYSIIGGYWNVDGVQTRFQDQASRRWQHLRCSRSVAIVLSIVPVVQVLRNFCQASPATPDRKISNLECCVAS